MRKSLVLMIAGILFLAGACLVALSHSEKDSAGLGDDRGVVANGGKPTPPPGIQVEARAEEPDPFGVALSAAGLACLGFAVCSEDGDPEFSEQRGPRSTRTGGDRAAISKCVRIGQRRDGEAVWIWSLFGPGGDTAEHERPVLARDIAKSKAAAFEAAHAEARAHGLELCGGDESSGYSYKAMA